MVGKMSKQKKVEGCPAPENVLQHIREDGSFSISYRLMIQGKPKQVTLKAVLPNSGNTDELIIGVRAWKDRK